MATVEIKPIEDGFHKDQKTGWSAYPFLNGFGDPPADLRGVHVVSILPGQVRGNHFHLETNELLLIFSGKGVFYWEEDGSLMERLIEGRPYLITIPAGVKHAFRNAGDDAVYLIAARDGRFNHDNPDIVRTKIIAD